MLTLEFEEHRTNEQGKEQFEEYDWWKELVRKAAEKQTLSSFAAGRMKKRELPSEKNLVLSRKAAPKSLYLPEQ